MSVLQLNHSLNGDGIGLVLKSDGEACKGDIKTVKDDEEAYKYPSEQFETGPVVAQYTLL